MRASRGLKWENKMYKLKRSIVQCSICRGKTAFDTHVLLPSNFATQSVVVGSNPTQVSVFSVNHVLAHFYDKG